MPVVIITVRVTSQSAIDAIQLGVYDSVTKPFDLMLGWAVRTRELHLSPSARPTPESPDRTYFGSGHKFVVGSYLT